MQQIFTNEMLELENVCHLTNKMTTFIDYHNNRSILDLHPAVSLLLCVCCFASVCVFVVERGLCGSYTCFHFIRCSPTSEIHSDSGTGFCRLNTEVGKQMTHHPEKQFLESPVLINTPYQIPTDSHFMLQGRQNLAQFSTGRISVCHLQKGELVFT